MSRKMFKSHLTFILVIAFVLTNAFTGVMMNNTINVLAEDVVTDHSFTIDAIDYTSSNKTYPTQAGGDPELKNTGKLTPKDTMPGTYLEYQFNITEEAAGDYYFSMNVTTRGTTAGAIDADCYLDNTVFRTVYQAGTNGWFNWTPTELTVINLTAGDHKLKVDFKSQFNLSVIKFIQKSSKNNAGVVPINWANLPISAFNDPTSLKMKFALNSACAKNLNEDWASTSNYGKEGQYIDFGSVEADIRPRAQHAMSIAVALKTSAYDEQITGFNSEFAKSVALTWIKSVAKDHTVNGGLGTAWGDVWQSPLWAYRCGLAAWLLWDDLSPTDQEYVRKMIEHEANRYYYVAPLFAGTGYQSDTKGEEDQWYAGMLQLVCNMMPNHPFAATWESQGKRYRLAAVAAPKDVNSSTVVDGKSLKDWGITSYNIDNEGTLGNHDLYPHPDYMCAIMNHPSEGDMMYKLGGSKPVPVANRYNLDIMFKYLIDEELSTGTIYNDDGTINWPIRAETYRKNAYVQYYNIDLFADYYGYDNLASQKASFFLPMHVQKWLDYIKTAYIDRSWAEESPATVWLAKCLLMSSTGTPGTQYYKILNKSKANYIYEAGGRIEYGTGTGDAYLWELADSGTLGYVFLKNKATGHVINIAGNNDYTQCDVNPSTDLDSAKWKLSYVTWGSDYALVQCLELDHPDYLHEEGQLGYIEHDPSGTTNTTGSVIKNWDSAKWRLEPEFGQLQFLTTNAYGLYSGEQQLCPLPQSEGTYTFKAQYINGTGRNTAVTFVLAVKDNNKIIKLYIIPKDIVVGETVNITQDITIPSANLVPGLEVKLMVFENLETIKPLAITVSIGR